jgi:arylformamidase
MIYDISPELNESLAVWPGDRPLTRELSSDMRRGDDHTLSSMRCTAHLGAHVDAPSHFMAEGGTITDLPLAPYIGRCRLLRVPVPAGGCIGPEALPERIEAERVLFATDSYPDPAFFARDFTSLSPELVHACKKRGIVLVGIDTPGVDPYGSDGHPAHKACFAGGIAILEGLRLADVPEGFYELIALPLRLGGFEASPVRAILRSLPL